MLAATVTTRFCAVAPFLVGLLLVLIVIAAAASAAQATTPTPAFQLHSMAYPSNFSASENSHCLARIEERLPPCDGYQITASENGALRTNGTAVTLTDTLPAGLEAQAVRFFQLVPQAHAIDRSSACTLVPLRCKFQAEGPGKPGTLKPDEALEMQVLLTVGAGAAGPLENSASVSGGGAQTVSTTSQNQLADEAAAFAPSIFSLIAASDGSPETQAGAHPYEYTTRLDLSSVIRPSPEGQSVPTSTEDLKDVAVDLPLGFVGSAAAAPMCRLSQLGSAAGCHRDTAVGRLYTEPEAIASANSAVFNMLPERGVAAEFGFTDVLHNTHVFYAKVVPSPAGYIVRAITHDVPQVAVTDAVVSLFGDPAAKDGVEGPQLAMFTNPSNCSGEELSSGVHADSWQRPGRLLEDGTPAPSPDLSDPNWVSNRSTSAPVSGCEALKFEPTITASPSSAQADSPTGLDVGISLPQQEAPEELGTPPLRDAVVALPRGMTVNASSVNGLQACSLQQLGMSAAGEPNADQASCPEASKIGAVELETPVLPSEICKAREKALAECPAEGEREKAPLKGSIYVARQGENPFGSLLAIYIVIDDPRAGVLVKIPAEVKTDETTGQLTTVVKDGPQFPFSELRTHFFSGDGASLATPPACGSYTLTSQLTPWSAPQSGPPASPESSFQITEGPGGGACASPFAPSFDASTQNAQAAAFSALSVNVARTDADQQLAGLSVSTPPGLLGVLKSVAQCPEPQASQGDCPADSLIGESSVAVGTGPRPYWVKGGRVYLTGPYNHGPFGLAILTPTTAGPYTLTGNGGPGREIVRSSIRVDPGTSQITVVSDALPRILQGIPLQIRAINVTVNRPGFIFNPTNCNPLNSSAAFSSTQGATATARGPFQARNCKALDFTPSFKAQTQAKTSKTNGASLRVELSYPASAQANIARVDLEIPKILPTRLTTLQKACAEAQFNANPAGCPPPSVIASATVHTPLLANPLSGPVYIVSHGGAAFPDVEMVLQGEGIALVVDGKTKIKNGATFSHFEAVPDAPFSSFQFIAPQGPYSIFTANGDLCRAPIRLPVKLTAQDGAVVEQDDPLAVTGCPSALKILSAKVRGRTLALRISVPSAGRLSAGGRGLRKATKTAKARGVLTLRLRAKGKGKLKTRVRLSFRPASGRVLSAGTKVTFR